MIPTKVAPPQVVLCTGPLHVPGILETQADELEPAASGKRPLEKKTDRQKELKALLLLPLQHGAAPRSHHDGGQPPRSEQTSQLRASVAALPV